MWGRQFYWGERGRKEGKGARVRERGEEGGRRSKLERGGGGKGEGGGGGGGGGELGM